jgi:hypothetical protein
MKCKKGIYKFEIFQSRDSQGERNNCEKLHPACVIASVKYLIVSNYCRFTLAREGASLESEKPVSAVTLLLVAILSVALTCFWDLFVVFLPDFAVCTQSVSNLIPTYMVDLMGGPFVMFLLTIPLMRIPPIRRHLTVPNLVYIYITALGVSYYASIYHPWWHDGIIVVSRVFTLQSYLRFVPDYVAVPKETADLLMQGIGNIGAIPWAVLFPGILWRFLFVALFGCISIGIANIFRHQWMDVEVLPFPQVLVAHTCLVNIENMDRKEWFQRKPFLIGISVGILLAIPLSGITLFPWFPDIYGWRTNTCAPGSQYVAPPDIPWNLGINKHPPVYALLLLVPLNYLISLVFYTFVYEASIFIAYYAFGAYTGYLSKGFCGRSWCSSGIPNTDPPLMFATLNTGAMLGLFVITIILERGHIVRTLRSAFGTRLEEEIGEPISYRVSWVILITSYVLLMTFFAFTGFSPWVSFVLPLSGIITWFIMAQLWGKVGFCPSPCYHLTPGVIRMFVWPSIVHPEVVSTDVALVPVLSRGWIGHGYSWGGSFFTVLASYKMASITGVNPRNVLKVMVVGLFIAMFTTEILQTVVMGIYGYNRFPSKLLIWPLEGYQDALWSNPSTLPMTQATPHLVIGFVFMVVMGYLCTRFFWLPNPIMLIVAWEWISSICGIWAACLVAWAIKYTVLRLGGSKLYEQWVVPFVGGFILGDALEVLVAALTAYGLSGIAI